MVLQIISRAGVYYNVLLSEQEDITQHWRHPPQLPEKGDKWRGQPSVLIIPKNIIITSHFATDPKIGSEEQFINFPSQYKVIIQGHGHKNERSSKHSVEHHGISICSLGIVEWMVHSTDCTLILIL